MITLRRMKAMVLGGTLSDEDLLSTLQASSVPVSEADCRTCPDPCTEGHESWRFDVDRETQMLGTVRPYCRQVVISTGKADWDRDVGSAKGTLAYFLTQVQHSFRSGSPSSDLKARRPAGIFTSSDSTKMEILNGSHNTICDDDRHETVLVFPDYKVVTGVQRSLDSAQTLWDNCLDPQLGRTGASVEKTPFSSWIIPYSCVILLCSHKRRDNRCHIAAAKLEDAFTASLELKGWQVDTQLEHPLYTSGQLPLEEIHGSEKDQEDYMQKQFQALPAEKRCLIIRNSHIGGHRYAGNCIIYTPQGSGVWYGRVSVHEVESIVTKTLEEGMILAQLLRGGINISKPGCSSLHDW